MILKNVLIFFIFKNFYFLSIKNIKNISQNLYQLDYNSDEHNGPECL